MVIAFPGESPQYRAARNRLLERESELRRAMEAVPAGGVVPEDYVFQGAGADGTPSDVRLSELFAPGKDSLVIYSFMFPRDPGDERPGPGFWRDGAPGAKRRPMPLVRCLSRPARRRCGACQPAPQLRGRREGPAGARPHLCRGARLAA